MIEAEKGSVAFGLMQEIRKLEDRVKVLESGLARLELLLHEPSPANVPEAKKARRQA